VVQIADIGGVLGSPVWTVLATVLAAAAIWVSIWLYRRQRTRKSLSYTIKVTELVSVHQAAKGRIKILFDEEEIERAQLVEARIENDGNVPITIEDFQLPFVFDLGEGATALTADITKCTPDDLPAQVYVVKNEIEIQPLLLNPGDGLTIKSFARNLQQKPVPHCRIVGVSKLRDAADDRQRQAQRTTLRRSLAAFGFEGLGAIAVLALTVAGVTSWLFISDKHTESLVKLTSGPDLCGDVLHTSDQKIVVQLAESGKIRALNLSEVQSIEENEC
jgi:hypothetical protein